MFPERHGRTKWPNRTRPTSTLPEFRFKRTTFTFLNFFPVYSERRKDGVAQPRHPSGRQRPLHRPHGPLRPHAGIPIPGWAGGGHSTHRSVFAFVEFMELEYTVVCVLFLQQFPLACNEHLKTAIYESALNISDCFTQLSFLMGRNFRKIDGAAKTKALSETPFSFFCVISRACFTSFFPTDLC